MKRFACALVTMCLCLWLAGCSGKTEKTDGTDKTKTTDDSAKKQGQQNAWASGQAAKYMRGFAQGIGRGVGELGRATAGVSDQAGGPGGFVSHSEGTQGVEKSTRLGAFLRAVGLSSGQQPANLAPPEPELGPSAEVVSPSPGPGLP